MAVSHLGGNGLPAEVGTLWIQVSRHRPECGSLHCPVWKAIRCAIHFTIVRLIRWYGCVLVSYDGAANVRHMRATSPAASFFTRGGLGSLQIGKASPLASDSEARAAAATMSWAVAMLWDRM